MKPFRIFYNPADRDSTAAESIRKELRDRGWEWEEVPTDKIKHEDIWANACWSFFFDFDHTYPSAIYLTAITQTDGVWRFEGKTKEEYDLWCREVLGDD